MTCEHYRPPKDCPEFDPQQCKHPDNGHDGCAEDVCPQGRNRFSIEEFRAILVAQIITKES